MYTLHLTGGAELNLQKCVTTHTHTHTHTHTSSTSGFPLSNPPNQKKNLPTYYSELIVHSLQGKTQTQQKIIFYPNAVLGAPKFESDNFISKDIFIVIMIK